LRLPGGCLLLIAACSSALAEGGVEREGGQLIPTAHQMPGASRRMPFDAICVTVSRLSVYVVQHPIPQNLGELCD